MIKLEIVSVRQLDKNIIDQFFNSDLGIAEYIKKHFQDTNKLISMSSITSEDYTTQTKTLIFKSQEDYDAFLNDDVLQYQNVLQTRYNLWHNITANRSVTEI
jgi:succinylglutamate desuccinylase